MKKINKTIENKPLNGDNRLKNICAWFLIVAIVLGLVGGVLGSLCFFGVRKASAEEIIQPQTTYRSSARVLGSVSFAKSNETNSFSYDSWQVGFLNISFQFEFVEDGFYVNLVDNSSTYPLVSTMRSFIPKTFSYWQYDKPLFSDNSFVYSSRYWLRVNVRGGDFNYVYSNDLPLYSSAVILNYSDTVSYSLYSNSSIVNSSLSSSNYTIRFSFDDSEGTSSQNYIDFIIPCNVRDSALLPSDNSVFDTRYFGLNNNAYQNGYFNGLNDANRDKDKLVKNAYNNGFNDGIKKGNDYSFLGLMSAVIDVPIKAFTSLLNFEILGINLSAFMFGLLTLALIIFIVKLFVGGGSK